MVGRVVRSQYSPILCLLLYPLVGLAFKDLLIHPFLHSLPIILLLCARHCVGAVVTGKQEVLFLKFLTDGQGQRDRQLRVISALMHCVCRVTREQGKGGFHPPGGGG